MTEYESVAAEQRLYEAVTRWDAGAWYGSAEIIDAACRALVEGLDSPALCELAGASARDSQWDLRELVSQALAELRIPYPGTVPTGSAVAKGGGITRRLDVDSLRLAVTPAPAGGFQVQVYVNDVEMTEAGAGLGMDPYQLLVPTNRLLATSEPRTIPIARCECGTYGCGSTDVTIRRDGDRVHWDWSIEVPADQGATFPAAGYDAEVARAAADHSWETPERTAGRLILTEADRHRLLAHGLALSWVGNHYRDRRLFLVALRDATYQVFVHIPWQDRTPQEVARSACDLLASSPGQWSATWQSMYPAVTAPPAIAGPSWRRA
ncbi:hypothetical protein V6V47_00900 [Micromonospora sp. CPCC 205539]|uniref:hypothetical protein n=1 Tax=Micromonospora sp. CPCC 205539 TaxID=3122408 RepID=UPI002FF28B9C